MRAGNGRGDQGAEIGAQLLTSVGVALLLKPGSARVNAPPNPNARQREALDELPAVSGSGQDPHSSQERKGDDNPPAAAKAGLKG